MDSELKSSLIEFFIRETVQPVTQVLKNKVPNQEVRSVLKEKIRSLTDSLIEEINSAYNSSQEEKIRAEEDGDVNQVLNYLLDKVEEMSRKASSSPPSLISEMSDFQIEQFSSPVLERQWFPRISSNEDMEPIAISVAHLHSNHEVKDQSSSPISSVSLSSEDSMKEIPSRKKMKRSLEDTVQMLSDDMKKTTKEDSLSPNLPQPQTLPFVLPHVPLPFSAQMMQRWLGSPFYMNTMFQQPKPNEEQLAALMKMSMHAANLMKSARYQQDRLQTNDSDTEDIKIDVESDEGEIETPPSPSSGDITENESASGVAPLVDGDSAMEKPFICMHNNCGKRFANKFLLKKHMFIHTGLRPHTCPHCHKKFNRKDNLLRHKKTHMSSGTHVAQILPKVNFSLPPGFHNLALTPGFNHFHAFKITLENGAPAVRSLS